MAALAGRDVRIKYDADGTGTGSAAAVIAGARVDNLTINNSIIDITDKDDNGKRTLLDDVGVQTFSMSCEGVLVGDTLNALARGADASAMLHDFEFEISGIGTYTGSFAITSFEVGGQDGDNAATFSASFESSGTVSWSAA